MLWLHASFCSLSPPSVLQTGALHVLSDVQITLFVAIPWTWLSTKSFFSAPRVWNLIIDSFTLHRRRLWAEPGGVDVQTSNKKDSRMFVFLFIIIWICSCTHIAPLAVVFCSVMCPDVYWVTVIKKHLLTLNKWMPDKASAHLITLLGEWNKR